jgi:hypothetical protein
VVAWLFSYIALPIKDFCALSRPLDAQQKELAEVATQYFAEAKKTGSRTEQY